MRHHGRRHGSRDRGQPAYTVLPDCLGSPPLYLPRPHHRRGEGHHVRRIRTGSCESGVVSVSGEDLGQGLQRNARRPPGMREEPAPVTSADVPGRSRVHQNRLSGSPGPPGTRRTGPHPCLARHVPGRPRVVVVREPPVRGGKSGQQADEPGQGKTGGAGQGCSRGCVEEQFQAAARGARHLHPVRAAQDAPQQVLRGQTVRGGHPAEPGAGQLPRHGRDTNKRGGGGLHRHRPLRVGVLRAGQGARP